MPRLKNAVPKYRKHRASGQAIVTIEGRDIYLGPHNSKASRLEYDRIVTEWLAAGRKLPVSLGEIDLSVVEVLARYKKFAKLYYRKDGRPTGEWENIERAIKPVQELYGRTPAKEFGSLALKAVREKMIKADLSRGVINARIARIKRVFRWAASEELIPATVVGKLETVAGLEEGRSEAREAKPVLPVPDEIVDKTLPRLPQVVADMVRLQRLTGCRPGEICALRPCDVDRTGEIWCYTPAGHKMEHLGRPPAP
jgi:integrase